MEFKNTGRAPEAFVLPCSKIANQFVRVNPPGMLCVINTLSQAHNETFLIYCLSPALLKLLSTVLQLRANSFSCKGHSRRKAPGKGSSGACGKESLLNMINLISLIGQLIILQFSSSDFQIKTLVY